MKTLRKRKRAAKKHPKFLGKLPKGKALASDGNTDYLWVWLGETAENIGGSIGPVLHLCASKNHFLGFGKKHIGANNNVIDGIIHVASERERKRFSHWWSFYKGPK